MLKNELLQQALGKIEAGIDDKASYDKLLSAGLKAAYDKTIFDNLTKGLPESKDPIGDTAKGVVFLMKGIAEKARGTAPTPALMQAGFALMLHALDFEEEAGLIKVGKAEIDEATHDFMNVLLPSVGLDEKRLAGILSQLKETASDPAKLKMFQQAVEAA